MPNEPISSDVRAFILNNKRWRFSRKYDLGRSAEGHPVLGKCDPPDQPNKGIRVLATLKGEKELDTIIHEALHAAAWTVLDEGFVDQTAEDLARLLWRLGYRKVHPEA